MPDDTSESGTKKRDDLEVAAVAARYESVAAADVNDWLRYLLLPAPARVLDVGAGTGRDAAWLSALGYNVVAVEPDRAMRAEAVRRHPGMRFELLPDRLPELTMVRRTGLPFDFILLNAVWMFIAPTAREQAFRTLVSLLVPRGVMAFTLRCPIEAGRAMHPVSAAEIRQLARRHGADVESTSEAADHLQRPGVRWTRVAVRGVSSPTFATQRVWRR